MARLSPLGHGHVTMLGRYSFTLPDSVARGELRPLRDPHAIGPDDPCEPAYVGFLLRCYSEPLHCPKMPQYVVATQVFRYYMLWLK